MFRPGPGRLYRGADLRHAGDPRKLRAPAARAASSPWLPLQVGDIIDVIAPSSPPADPAATIAAIQAYFARTDLKVRIPDGLIAPTQPLQAANTAERRVAFIEQALHSDSKAVWAIQGGGWGSELMPLLQRMRQPARPKPVIGFSDVTALHIFFNHVWGWPTLHGIELGANGDIGAGWNHDHIDEMLSVLRGHRPTLSYPLTALNDPAARPAVLDKLRVVGGNSLLLSALKGSVDFTTDTAGAILFIESIANGPGEVSRLLDGFLYSTLVRQAGAVMFGDFIHVGGLPNPPQEQQKFDYIQRRFGAALASTGTPVLRAENLFGHGPVNRPLPLNTSARLTLGERPLLAVQAGNA
ncbi:LD-carboxypeptidase [Roseateles chitinivorans]|uniref:LD-carboxypeptidase n=1 Tax=Roseateles chitinivorans TaxID=2917965 RepID=UPI003D67FAE8